MTVQNIAAQIIGIYLILEAIDAAASMDRGDKICRMLKYLLCATSGGILLFYSFDWYHLLFGLTISAFLWAKFVQRLLYVFHAKCNTKAFDCLSVTKQSRCTKSTSIYSKGNHDEVD